MNPVLVCNGEDCRISGAVTFSRLDGLSVELLEYAARQEEMKLSLHKVSECDSAFIALLMACLQIKKQQNQTIRLSGCPKKLLDMIDVYGLTGSGMRVC